MNVLFIETACDGTIGGSHTCLFNLLNNLDRNTYRMCVGVYQNNAFVDKLREIGVNVFLLPRNPVLSGNVFIRKIRNWYRLIYRHRIELSRVISSQKIDVLVLNNSIAGGKDYVHVCSKFGIPVLAYERGYIQYTAADILLSNRIDASIAVSNAVRENMMQQAYSAKARVIYDGLPIWDARPANTDIGKSEIKKGIGLPDDSVVIGIVGNIREWKGQEYFVKAFISLGEKYNKIYALVVGGHGIEDREYTNHLEKLAMGTRIRDRLLYLGFREDVPDLLGILDVFVHASIKPEPFGMVLLEAMLHRVPVIATGIGGPVEILANGGCGILVPPRDEHAVAGGVEKYLNDRLFREEMVRRAHRRVKTEFIMNNTVSQVDNLFREVVGRARVGLKLTSI